MSDDLDEGYAFVNDGTLTLRMLRQSCRQMLDVGLRTDLWSPVRCELLFFVANLEKLSQYGDFILADEFVLRRGVPGLKRLHEKFLQLALPDAVSERTDLLSDFDLECLARAVSEYGALTERNLIDSVLWNCPKADLNADLVILPVFDLIRKTGKCREAAEDLAAAAQDMISCAWE